MKMALALALASLCCAQNIPGLGTDPLKKGPIPPVVEIRTDPPQAERAESAHTKALSELKNLIEAATSLRDQLEADGPSVVRTDTTPKLRAMDKALKAIKSTLKAKS